MNLFQHSLYRTFNEKKQNRFEKCFKELTFQIEFDKKQFDFTIKSYRKEREIELKDAQEHYTINKSRAEKIYTQTYNDNINDEYGHSLAMHESGLDHIEYNYYETKEEIDSKFNDFFDLYSKSILIALYSLNESTLNKISNLSSEVFAKKIKPSHFNSRDYLLSSLNYLDLVIEVDITSLQNYISKLKDIQYLRNNIVHNLSTFQDVENISDIIAKYNDIIKLDRTTGYLRIVKIKFIEDLFILINNFYEELLWLIEKKQDSEIIKNGLKFWLGILDKDIIISDVKINKHTKIDKQIYFKLSSKEFSEYESKITLKRSKKMSFNATDQTDNLKFQDFIEFEKENNARYLLEVFETFNNTQDKYEINLIFY
jgi:hypothetical protein